MEFSVLKDETMNWAMTVSVFPQGGAYNRALKNVNYFATLFSVGGGQWLQMTGLLNGNDILVTSDYLH